jgi:hypothetical protein
VRIETFSATWPVHDTPESAHDASGHSGVVRRASSALLLSPIQANVVEFERRALPPDDEQERKSRLLLLDEN